MKLQRYVEGIVCNTKTMKFKTEKLYVQYTDDEYGKSLSITNPESGLQFHIPFGHLIKLIK